MSIDKIKNIGLDKLVTQVYDFDSLTTDELMCKFAQKINIIIEHFNYLDDRCYNSDKAMELKLQYLLGQGLEEQVAKRLLELTNNGTLEKLINETLLKNINDKVDKIEQQIEINVLMFGCKNDGEFDNTTALKSLFDSLDSTKSYTIVFPTGTYKITDEILINKNNITLDFKNSNIFFSSTKNYDFNASKGIFKFFNSREEYASIVKSVDNFYRVDSNRNHIVTKLYLNSNLENFNINDYISVLLHVGSAPFTKRMPSLSSIAKIIDKQEDGIVIDYYCPYDFKEYNNVFTVNRIRKYNMCENIKIKNCNFTFFDKIYDISPFAFVGCKNVTVNNCYFTKSSLPCVYGVDCINILTQDCFLENPLSVEAGKGYLVKYVSCHNGNVENCKADNVRHLVDFSGGWLLSVKNCYDYTPSNLSSGSYDCHGIGEHTIIYDNCYGSFSLGNGTQFPQIMKDIKITNSFITDIINNAFINLTISNSEITFNYKNALFFDMLNIDNSTIILCPSGIGHVDIRGFNTKELTFDTCNFISRDIKTKSNIYIKNFINLRITNCNINNVFEQGLIDLSTCENIYIDKSKISNFEISIDNNIDIFKSVLNKCLLTSTNNTSGNRIINLDSNKFICGDNDKIINFKSINATDRLNVILYFNNNFIDNPSATTSYYLLYNNSNHYVYVYSNRNVSRKEITKTGSSVDLFSGETSLQVLDN
jgi:hypothetical protein